MTDRICTNALGRLAIYTKKRINSFYLGLDIWVPEAVRVDMRKPPPLRELIQPCRDAGGIHGPSVVLGEQIPGTLPAVPIGKPERRLGRSVFFQQRTVSAGILTKRTFPVFVVVS